MKAIDSKELPIHDKKIEEFKKLNPLTILEKSFFKNEFKDIQIKDYEYLKELNYNIIFITNSTINYIELKDEINFRGTNIEISKSLENPLIILNIYEDKNIHLKNNLTLKIKNDIKVSIIEIFISKGRNNFIDESRTFYLEKDSKINYIKIQNINKSDFFNINYSPNIKDNSILNVFSFDYGSLRAVNIWHTNLYSQNSDFSINGIVKISQNQEVANIATTVHNNINTKSNIDFKHILNDNSHAIYEVKSIVNNCAKYSNSLQNSSTILLSDDAKINATPRLEIFIDELSASHGATTGSLDEEVLYYLQTRGLSKQQAIKILLDAYEDAIIEKIDSKTIKEFTKRFIKDL